MDLQEVEVTISADGQVDLHVRGVKGDACLFLTDDLEKVLGTLINRKFTSEVQEGLAIPEQQDLHLKS
jgi:hypothetical protein